MLINRLVQISQSNEILLIKFSILFSCSLKQQQQANIPFFKFFRGYFHSEITKFIYSYVLFASAERRKTGDEKSLKRTRIFWYTASMWMRKLYKTSAPNFIEILPPGIHKTRPLRLIISCLCSQLVNMENLLRLQTSPNVC